MVLVVWSAAALLAAVVALSVRARTGSGGRAPWVALALVLVGLAAFSWGGSGRLRAVEPATVVYSGSYVPLRGLPLSQAYSSSLDISFGPVPGLDTRNLVPLRAVRAALRGPVLLPAADAVGDGGVSALRRHLEVELVLLLPLGVVLPLLRRPRGALADVRLVAVGSLLVSLVLCAGQQLFPTGEVLDVDVVVVNVLGATALAAVAALVAGRRQTSTL